MNGDPSDPPRHGLDPRFAARLLNLAAPVAAVVLAMMVCGVLLSLTTDAGALETYRKMWDWGSQPDQLVEAASRAVPLFMSGLAVSIGFRMGLFNIGVEGQYRLAALCAGALGAWMRLPAPLHVTAVLVTAMGVGGIWAGVAGLARTTRGVNEVISTIMLNFIAYGLADWLFANHWKLDEPGNLNPRTPELPGSAQLPALVHSGTSKVTSFALIAVALGVAFYLLVWRTRFGFDLRASGANPVAARTAGVNPSRMVMSTMVLSGMMAGLVGMPALLGDLHHYSNDFPKNLGFNGIAVALLGRNHPIGIALAALLFGALDSSAIILDLDGIPKEIVQIMQAVIVLSVVIAYEVTKRLGQRRIASATAVAAPSPATPSPAGGA